MTLIYIDPGHGGIHPGAVARDGSGRMEKDGVLDIAFRVKQYLVAHTDWDVRMTRDSDVHVSLIDRARMANRAHADLFVSIHMNSVCGDIVPTGVEVYAWDKTSPYAHAILDNMLKYMSPTPKNRGVKAGVKYATIRRTRMPSVVVECGFIANNEEVKLLWDDEYRQRIAKGIAEGIICRGSHLSNRH